MDAIDYLLKPFSLARFLQACNKAYELYCSRTPGRSVDHLYVKSGYEQVRVDIEDILYIEATGNYVTFVLTSKKVMTRSTFAETARLLPQKDFVRVHRSYLVAVGKIEKVERHQVTVGAKRIPV